ncbi:MAG: cyclic nucleotide-binding domain-containing protein [Pseudomonadota bacterium]
MKADFKIAIIGSGPAGLSAAGHCADLGISHILLEAQDHLADTIYKYQKGKHVMAEPAVLGLRSPVSFAAGSRESILNQWTLEVASLGVLVQHNAQVTGITGTKGSFQVELASSEIVSVEHVVLAIGLQGNLRTLGVEGDNLPGIQYQLDNPEEYQGETIIVVGAGDAAIENALALAKANNRVILLNRNEEFTRCKDGNLTAIQAAGRNNLVSCRFSTQVDHIEGVQHSTSEADMNKTMMVSHVDLSKRHSGRGTKPGLSVVLNTPTGEERIECHRIIARLGATPPRKLVESFGVRFTSRESTALPELSTTYESSVPGLYVIGALGGYPLIKQAMNQGYEVVETIMGRAVESADEPLLRQKFAEILKQLPHLGGVSDVLELVGSSVPLFEGLTALQLREVMLDSDLRMLRSGTEIFKRNDYSNSFFSIVSGTVKILGETQADDIMLDHGQFFGEMGLISGRRRSATAVAGLDCLLVETPRRAMLKLLATVDAVRRNLDLVALRRAVRKYVAGNVTEADLNTMVEGSTIKHYKTGEALFNEGDKADALYLIRRGSVMVSHMLGGREVVMSYVSAGNYVGEMALMMNAPRSATVRAAVPTEAILLDAEQVLDILARNTGMRQQLNQQYNQRVQANQAVADDSQSGNLISFLLKQGVGEATDVLLIDESLCVRCDHCEKACASTHEGVSRLDREAGPTYANLHVPTSCRHCEHPHCMKDCPPDAIHRSPNGEVFISDACIGCGNCEKNCPYDVIQMAPLSTKKKSGGGLLSWMLFGFGQEPGTRQATDPNDKSSQKKAVKCDMCKDIKAGPACVRACPTGAALRVSPESFLRYAGTKR